MYPKFNWVCAQTPLCEHLYYVYMYMECPAKCRGTYITTEAIALHECLDRCCEEMGWVFCASPRAMRCLYAAASCGLDALVNAVSETYGADVAREVRECVGDCAGALLDEPDGDDREDE